MQEYRQGGSCRVLLHRRYGVGTGNRAHRRCRKIATFSWPVKCRRSFVLFMSFSSVWVYLNHHGGKLHFRLKQHNEIRRLAGFEVTIGEPEQLRDLFARCSMRLDPP